MMFQKRDPFSALRQIANGIAAMFGNNCEVAVHDLSDLNHSLVHIAGNVTGREIGAPATDLLVRALSQENDNIEDVYNYRTTIADGRSIKSSTLFLKNEDDQVYAALCINLDTTDFFNASQVLAALINTENTRKVETQEKFAKSADETIEELFEQTLIEIGKHPVTMTTQERVDLVSRLYKKGVFQMKGAVIQIADLSGVSKYTIYNYIKNIENFSNARITGEAGEKNYPN